MKKSRSSALAVLALALTFGTSAAAVESAYRAELQQWRAQADQKLRAEDGPLAVIGLYWLHEGSNRVGAYPSNEVVLPRSVAPAKAGVVKVDGANVTFEAADAVTATLKERAVKRVALHDARGVSVEHFKIGRLKLSYLERELGQALRVSDPDSPARSQFQGQQWYPADEGWVLEGRFVPFASPRTIVYEAATGGTRTGLSPGYVRFQRGGKEYRLDVQQRGDEGYIAYFFDASTGKQTYAGGRVVPIARGAGDSVTLDFNKAANLPCAVSAFFNCQIAPPQNHLTALEIAAGEKKPLDKVARVASAPEYLK